MSGRCVIVLDMTQKTLNIMVKIEGRLNRLEAKAQCHCGYDEFVLEFNRAHDKFLKFIETELEKLQGGDK